MKRLDEIVVGAELHRFHRAIHHVVGAHHHDDARGIGSLDLAQNLDAVHPGQHDVEQHEIRFLIFKNLQRLFARGRGQNLEAFGRKSATDGAQRQIFIVDN